MFSTWLRPLALVLTLLLSPTLPADTLAGKVVKVVDGDTVYVLDAAKAQHKIRLAGIDAPERKQPYGTRSKEYLAGLVAGERVSVEWDKRDRYRRIVGKVLHDGPKRKGCDGARPPSRTSLGYRSDLPLNPRELADGGRPALVACPAAGLGKGVRVRGGLGYLGPRLLGGGQSPQAWTGGSIRWGNVDICRHQGTFSANGIDPGRHP